jgi:hypothetical protein
MGLVKLGSLYIEKLIGPDDCTGLIVFQFTWHWHLAHVTANDVTQLEKLIGPAALAQRPEEPPELAVVECDGGHARTRELGHGLGVHLANELVCRKKRGNYLVSVAERADWHSRRLSLRESSVNFASFAERKATIGFPQQKLLTYKIAQRGDIGATIGTHMALARDFAFATIAFFIGRRLFVNP